MTDRPHNATPGARILCVEDDVDSCEALAALLRLSGYAVTTAGTVAEGLHLAREEEFNLIILDNWFEKGSGIDLCRKIREFDPVTPILFYSAAAYETDIQQGLSAGAQAYIVKPQFAEFQRWVRETLSSSKNDKSC